MLSFIIAIVLAVLAVLESFCLSSVKEDSSCISAASRAEKPSSYETLSPCKTEHPHPTSAVTHSGGAWLLSSRIISPTGSVWMLLTIPISLQLQQHNRSHTPVS